MCAVWRWMHRSHFDFGRFNFGSRNQCLDELVCVCQVSSHLYVSHHCVMLPSNLHVLFVWDLVLKKAAGKADLAGHRRLTLPV